MKDIIYTVGLRDINEDYLGHDSKVTLGNLILLDNTPDVFI